MFLAFSFSIHTLLPQEKIKSFRRMFHFTWNVQVSNSSSVKFNNKNIFNILIFKEVILKSGFRLEYCLLYVRLLSRFWIYRCLTSSLSYLFHNRGLFFGSDMSLLEWVVPHEAQFLKIQLQQRRKAFIFMLKMLLEGTLPHLVQLLNAGEINQKREACFVFFLPSYQITKDMTQGAFLYKYLFFTSFSYISGYILISWILSIIKLIILI